jgi:hypothetical protein
MVKLEKLLDGGSATITRDGAELAVFEGQLFHEYELGSLKVLSGRVIYSVNEQEVVEVAAPQPKIEAIVAKPIKPVAAKSAAKQAEVAKA